MGQGKRLLLFGIIGAAALALAPPAATADVVVAGELFVDLRAEDLPVDTALGDWPNHGTLQDFEKVGEPYLSEEFGPPAVRFNQVTLDQVYKCKEPAPAGLLENEDCSIEVWVLNEDVASEDGMVSWGSRALLEG